MPILKGTIKNKLTGETLPGATIVINGDGKTTDSNGQFAFVLKNNVYQASVRFLGYKPQIISVPLYDNKDLTIEMEQDTSLLNQVEVKAKKTYYWLFVVAGTLATLYIFKKWKK